MSGEGATSDSAARPVTIAAARADPSRRDAVLRRYLVGDDVVAIGPSDCATGATPDPDLPDRSQDAVFANHALEHVGDYRRAIAGWFRVLRDGGHLLIFVPHQFLFERKLSPPSRWDAGHKRFYTAGLLLAEVEEALDPLSYRVRHLEENDQGFDYDAAPDRRGSGCHEIMLVIERIRRPVYADAVLDEPSNNRATGRYLRVPGPADHEPVVAIVSSAGPPLRVLLIKVDHRGDFILARPAMEMLRRAFPAARLTLVCGPWNRAEAEQLGFFDEVIVFTFFPEVASHVNQAALERAPPLGAFATTLAGRRFDVAIDLRVDPDTRPLLMAADADHRAGFGSADRFPFLDIALPFVNPTLSGRAEQRLFTPDRFTTLVGRNDGFAIVNPKKHRNRTAENRLIYGPYADLLAGDWTIEILIEPLGRDFDLAYDMVSDAGRNVVGYGALPVRRAGYPRIRLHLDEPVEDAEIRIYAGPSRIVGPFRFLGCRAIKPGSFPALHQQEMLLLLSSLVAHRMRFPYQTQEAAS